MGPRQRAATAGSRGPSQVELAALTCPIGLFAGPRDPFHPAAVAAQWAELIDHSHLLVGAVDDAHEATTFGEQTLAAWLRAVGGAWPVA